MFGLPDHIGIVPTPFAVTAVIEDDERICQAQTFHATRDMPTEFCEQEAEPGEDYCADHLSVNDPDGDPDYAYDRWREDQLGF